MVESARMAGKGIPAALLVGDVRVNITAVQLTFGKRFYFVCPRAGCRRRVETVYILGRVPACRKCHHLGYQSQARRDSSIYGLLDRLMGREDWAKPRRYDVDTTLLADVLDGARNDMATRLAADVEGITVAVEGTTST